MNAEQRELIFHDTVGLPTDQLEKGRKKAVRQKDIILAMFRDNPDMMFTPWDIERMYYISSGGQRIMITSVRRSITDLTKEGKLRKGDFSDQKEESFGANNNRWRFNKDYVRPLNAKP